MASIAPLIVITGPTASGKSAFALDLAEKWGGEIVCADSRTVYKGMDIGTAKPSKEEQKRIRHWGLDIIEPDERFTVVDFQNMANDAIRDIRSRGKIPFLVGGTGLYIDAVVLNYVFAPKADQKLRRELEKLSLLELVSLHQKQHLSLPENEKNRRYLIRSIEKNNASTSRNSQPNEDTHVFAIDVKKDILRDRINRRIDTMFHNNIVLETQHLLKTYDANCEAMTGNIYRVIAQMIAGSLGEEEAKRLCVTRDWQLAKRQITWLKRHDFVHWHDILSARSAIDAVLQNYRDA